MIARARGGNGRQDPIRDGRLASRQMFTLARAFKDQGSHCAG
jgi:hypothetical protein